MISNLVNYRVLRSSLYFCICSVLTVGIVPWTCTRPQQGYDARSSWTLRRFDARPSFVLIYRFTVSTDGDRQVDVPCCPFHHSFVAYRASGTDSVVTDVTAPT